MAHSALDNLLRLHYPYGFPMLRRTWNQAGLEATALPEKGQVSAYQVRVLARAVNQRRATAAHSAGFVQAGELMSVGLINDALRYLLLLYCHEHQPGVLPRGLTASAQSLGSNVTDSPPPQFVDIYPPRRLLRGQSGPMQFLARADGSIGARDQVVGELLLLSLGMANRAFRPYRDLFEDTELRSRSPYVTLVHSLEAYLNTQPPFAPLNLPLMRALRAPMEAAPDSLDGQLDYIRRHWAAFLPPDLLQQLDLVRGILREETMLRGLGPGPATALSFDSIDTLGDRGYAEPEAFSRDADWMSNVVLIAKSTYVWLHQLSRQYGRHIRHLNDIPDEELDRLARWGFTGLWLIGIWERSTASQRIKQIMGNPEAASSAYSLYDYVIADDLGGPAAFENLKQRAWRRGLRLASDMVPNHTGIYSKWVIEHPEWFIQEGYPPFPSYNFTGVDLSQDSRTVVQIEDGYWDRRDAAVVFKRYDKFTGECRYIYHGNDGTSMPWNDTAQLNFMMAEVREAVIQTILHVARLTPIIRFDAAMTLAKRHYQRLWFPKPGDGGAIPSRAERGLTKAEFDKVFPHEFWREVVDRVAAEVPDTLLLAEAFWLMEGYFVRTLGMHRVYNSAFMNMLKMEDNAKYRQTIKNVLEFSPQILKRFVNFMSNPDEATAVEQFGKGDKYYGIAVLMVTMPGLPMFGHGQIEGFAEKYGMEYRRSYWDESVDEGMVRHHEHAIFPLMRRRHLFSGAEHFALLDFVSDQGWVDENVLAYSNQCGHERAVIIFNNAYSRTSGRLSMSTAINIGSVDAKHLVRRSLGEALGLRGDDGVYYAYRDYRSGLEFLRRGRRLCEEGLHVALDGYQYHALLDFRELSDSTGLWSRLADRIGDSGVPDLALAYDELRLEPILRPLYRAAELSARYVLEATPPSTDDIERATAELRKALPSSGAAVGGGRTKTVTLDHIRDTLDRVGDCLPGQDARTLSGALALWAAFYGPTGKAAGTTEASRSIGACLDSLGEIHIYRTITRALTAVGLSDEQAAQAAWLAPLLSDLHRALAEPEARLGAVLHQAMEQPDLRTFLGINQYEGTWWLNKERFELYLAALRCSSHAVEFVTKSKKSPLREVPTVYKALLEEAASKGYRFEPIQVWLELLADDAPKTRKAP